jgi:phage-related protein
MPTRSLNVVIAADSRGFHKAAADIDRDTDRLQKRFSVTADSAQGLSLRVGAVAGSLGQMAPVVAGLAPALTGLAGAGAAVGSSFASAAAGASALGVGFAASMAPIAVVGKQVTSRFEAIKTAYDALKKAQTDHTDASKKAAQQAMAGLSTSEQAMARSLGRISDLQRKVLGGASDRIFKSLAGAIPRVAPVLEKLAGPFNRLGDAIGGVITRVSKDLTSGPWSKALRAFVDSATKLVGPISTIGISIANILRDVATAALPMVQDAIKGVAHWFRELDKTATTSKIRSVVTGLVDQAKSWFNLFRQLGGLVARVFGVGAKQGQGFVDALASAVKAVNHFIDGMRNGTGAGGKFKDSVTNAFEKVKTTVQRVVANVKTWLDRHRDDIHSVIVAFQRVADFAKTTWQETLLPTIRRTIKAVGPIISGLADTVKGLVRLVSGLLSGNWDKAWSGAKETVRGALKAVGKYVATSAGNLAIEMATLGPKLTAGLLKGIGNMGKALATGITRAVNEAVRAVPGMVAGALGKLGGAITSTVQKGIGKLNPFGIGDGVGKSPLPAGTFGGGLHGADPRMAPFASMASRFGLGISAGRSDHNLRTTSGNLSYHGTGEALDFSNGYETPQEMAFARYMVSAYGARLAELIYTPLGFSIKDGRRVAPIAASDHHDHVHVAFDLGRPGVGIGDGPGRRRFTGDGIGESVASARRAGFSGEPLVNMLAIAGRESHYQHGRTTTTRRSTTAWGDTADQRPRRPRIREVVEPQEPRCQLARDGRSCSTARATGRGTGSTASPRRCSPRRAPRSRAGAAPAGAAQARPSAPAPGRSPTPPRSPVAPAPEPLTRAR